LKRTFHIFTGCGDEILWAVSFTYSLLCPLRFVDTNTSYCCDLRNFVHIADAFFTAVSSTATESYTKLAHFQWVAWNLSAEVTSLHASSTHIYFKTSSGISSRPCV